MRSDGRVGLTLIEVLVVITIIGILLSLLIPAVQMAREAGRRSHCASNLAQLGLAVHNYANSFGSFPPGYITSTPRDVLATERSHWSWGALILPYLEQKAVYDVLKVGPQPLWLCLTTTAGRAALQTPLAVFVCPSDTGPALNDFDEKLSDNPSDAGAGFYNRFVTSDGTDRIPIAKSNYAGVACSSISTTPPVDPKPYGPATGVLFQNSAIKYSEITDGTSNTLMIGERSFRVKTLNLGAANALGFSSTVNTPGTSGGIKSAAMCVLGLPYNGINVCMGERVHQGRGFHSLHPGGAQFVLCDGSVRFINENIENNWSTAATFNLKDGAWVDSAYERLCARNDGQPVGDF